MKIMGYNLSCPKGVKVSKIKIRGKHGQISILIARKEGITEPATGVLWIHGGGYATGFKEMLYMGRGIDLALRHGAVVISPSYTLSYKAPYPAAIDDCYNVLIYIKEHTAELGIRDDQIMVGGESAGGGLTAALCMMARDRKEVNMLYHAFDMNSPKLDISKEAIERFNERFAYAREHYFAEQT